MVNLVYIHWLSFQVIIDCYIYQVFIQFLLSRERSFVVIENTTAIAMIWQSDIILASSIESLLETTVIHDLQTSFWVYVMLMQVGLAALISFYHCVWFIMCKCRHMNYMRRRWLNTSSDILLALAFGFLFIWLLIFICIISIWLKHFARVIKLHILILIQVLSLLLALILFIYWVLFFSFIMLVAVDLNPYSAWVISLFHLRHEICYILMILFVHMDLLLYWHIQITFLRWLELHLLLIHQVVFLQMVIKLVCLRLSWLIWHHDYVLLGKTIFAVLYLCFWGWIDHVVQGSMMCYYTSLWLFLDEDLR